MKPGLYHDEVCPDTESVCELHLVPLDRDGRCRECVDEMLDVVLDETWRDER